MKQIFLITPYAADNNFSKKKEIIEKICNGKNIRLVTAQDHKIKDALNNDETLRVFEKIDLFIADLSFERPSCYYEVGYIQGLKKEIRLIAQAGTLIHQVKGDVTYYTSLEEYEIIIDAIIIL